VNVLVIGAPLGAAGALARELPAGGESAPVTLLSSDRAGLLAALDRPGLPEVVWADPAEPATCDDAVVHRQLLHGTPDAVVAAVDGPADWSLAEQVARRLPGVPLLLTGPGAGTVGGSFAALVAELAELSGRDPLHAVVADGDGTALRERLATLVAAADRSPLPPAGHAGPGHCAH
jgi:hypothetical protein